MRASVLFEQGKPLSVEELELEPPRAGEVLVRMAASGVCHSCLHAADGSWKGVPVPIVLGDEGAGEVVEVGPGVDGLQRGDHVILSWAPTCGRCHYCVIGRPNLCERRQPGRGVLPDGTTRMSLRGRAVYHYGHVATYASSTVVHESCAIKIDQSVPLDRAALIGCSVMTGVGAVINTAAVPPGASMAVFGVGGVGLNVVQGAKLAGARTIIACDLLDNKLTYAKTFGATHTINAKRGDVVKQVQALTDGLGVDAAFDAIGGEAAALQALDAVAPGGRAVLVGIPAFAVRAPISPSNMVWAEKTISGTYYGSVRPDVDFPILADLDMDKKLNLDDLISRIYKFDEINEGFRLLVSGSVARGLIEFD